MNSSRHSITPYPPEKAQAVTLYEGGGVGITSTGPRGGWSHMGLSAEGANELAVLIVEAKTGQQVCHSCFRPEGDCSRDPCPDVVADRDS